MNSYVIVGVGGRAKMYIEALSSNFLNNSELLAICDNNLGRLKLVKDELEGKGQVVEGYQSEYFDEMLAKHKPNYVIVTTMDCAHDDYICRSLEAGCDVITEKPMTIDERRCQRIIDTIKKTGGKVRVTFNYRYSPPRSQIKKLLADGLVGKVLSVNFNWYLDTNHGADYFRRWHSNKCNSGGLIVHKSTHHFDLVNWWLSSVPRTVFAQGQRVFYNTEQARRFGLETHGDRCLDCKLSDRCNFYLDMTAIPLINDLYLKNEQYDGYIRDRCIFRGDIDIEDSVGLVTQYRNGAILTYSLNAFMPWEGYRLEINGTKGRLEHFCQETSYVSGDGTVQGALRPEGTSLKMYPYFQTPYRIPIWEGTGAHGGGDVVLLEDIFGNPGPDSLKRAADYVQGAYSVLLGIAANKSMSTGKMINIDDLVEGLPDPDFVPNAGNNEIVSFVSDGRLMNGDQEVVANVPESVYKNHDCQRKN